MVLTVAVLLVVAIFTIALLAITTIAGAEEARWQIAAAFHIPLLAQAAESDRSAIIKFITVTGTLDVVTASRVDEHLATGTVDHRHSIAFTDQVVTVTIIIATNTLRLALWQSHSD